VKYVHLIWANLMRKKVRTILTFLSITVAFLLYGYLSAIERSFNQGVDVAGADRLIVRHKVSIIQLLPISYLPRIEQIEGVDLAVHSTWFGGIYQDPKNFIAQMPVDPEPFLDIFPEFILEPDEREAWLNTRTGAIAGITTAERFGWKIGDRIPIQATIWPQKDDSQSWEFDLVGIYEGEEKGTDTTQFFFRYDYFDEARKFGEGLVGWYTVRIDDPDRAAEVAQAIDDTFANSAYETKSEPEGAFVQAFVKQIGEIGTIMVAILGAVFFTIVLVTGNTMAQSVRERTQEIAVLKAMGFTHVSILGLVLTESVVLSGTAGVAGIALAWALISQGDPTPGFLPIFYFPTRDVLQGLVMVFLLGLVTGIFPAVQAMRLKIADAIRR